MSTLRIIIAEDVTNLEIDLQNRLNEMGYEVLGLVSSPKDAFELLASKSADLVLMDTYSDLQQDGFYFAKKITETYNTPVAFLSGEDRKDFIEKISEFGSCLFMNKPISDNELKANIALASAKNMDVKELEKVSASSPYIFVRADYRLNKIRVSDIYYLEAKKDYVIIHTSDNVYTVHATMKDMVRVLPDDLFIRTHRSYIVNIDKVFSIKYPDLIIEGKMKTIQIGGLYRKSFFEKINII
jgi:DNA-binding LytR/AlgR family response regulator